MIVVIRPAAQLGQVQASIFDWVSLTSHHAELPSLEIQCSNAVG